MNLLRATGREGQAVEIARPECKKGLGSLIRSPQSKDVISGVQIQPFSLHPDDRGHFLEVARLGCGLVADFAPQMTQISASVSYPGTIKAFHYHLRQTDFWVPAGGMLQVALVDLRKGSPTFGARNTLYVGMMRPWQILIPPGVAHGYKVLGVEPAVLVYVTSRFYDPEDEGRIPYDDPQINYDWEIQHK